MPVPDLSEYGPLTYEEIEAKVKEEPYCLEKDITFDWVIFNNRTRLPVVITYEARGDMYPCSHTPECLGAFMTFLRVYPSGVMTTCLICGKTDGPITHQNMEEVSRREITQAEAQEILKRTHQIPPQGVNPVKEKTARVMVAGRRR